MNDSGSPAPSRDGAVVGVGIDVADVARLGAAMQRRPGLADRLFTGTERQVPDLGDPVRSALRFAAKEAVMKAMGVGIDSVAFTDIEVCSELTTVELSGRAADRAASIGVARIVVSARVVDGPTGRVAVAEAVATSSVG